MPLKEKQATMTGRSWRHFSVFWPFIVAGLIGPPEDTDAAPPQPGNDDHVPRTTDTRAETSINANDDRDGSINQDGWVGVDGDDLAVEDEPLGELPEADVAASTRYLAVFKHMAVHDAVLELFCKAAALGGRLFGDNTGDTTTLSEAQVRGMEADAEVLGIDYLQTLYGRINTSKIHRLVYHLGDELRSCGNLWEGDTSQNEALHGACKRMYKRTNKRGPGVALQMMRCEQTQAEVLKEVELADNTTTADRSGPLVLVSSPAHTADLSFSRRGERVAVGDLLLKPALRKMAERLANDGVHWLMVSKTARIVARFEWGAAGKVQYVRATPSFMGKAWYSFIRYESDGGEMRWGRARLVVRSFGQQQRNCVIVQRLLRVDARSGCVLSSYGCLRLGWDFESVSDEFPALEVVDVTRILRLEDIQVDWRDLADRLGLRAMPSNMAHTPIQLRAARYFTNPFYPWTSRALVPTL